MFLNKKKAKITLSTHRTMSENGFKPGSVIWACFRISSSGIQLLIIFFTNSSFEHSKGFEFLGIAWNGDNDLWILWLFFKNLYWIPVVTSSTARCRRGWRATVSYKIQRARLGRIRYLSRIASSGVMWWERNWRFMTRHQRTGKRMPTLTEITVSRLIIGLILGTKSVRINYFRKFIVFYSCAGGLRHCFNMIFVLN